MYRNVRQAFIGELQNLMEHGKSLPSRNGQAVEVCGREIVIEHPEERWLLLSQRNDNPIAKIAETMWVLAGRNDMNYLEHYLPRARDYSDDGMTWRAAYGPRLRNWYRYSSASVDQVAACLNLLRADPTSRRAVMTIFDPGVDYAPSKDIPCNNWIQWLIRDNKLHMYVAIRSNDVMWGFSGINAFEWSVLQGYMASWLDVGIGEYHQFVGSLHLYEPHFKHAEKILANWNGFEPYEYDLTLADFAMTCSYENFASQMQKWFWIELKARSAVLHENHEYEECYDLALHLNDPWLRSSAYAIIAANALPHNLKAAYMGIELMPYSAMRVSVAEYFCRMNKAYAEAHPIPIIMETIQSKPERKAAQVVDFGVVCRALKTLEYKKTLRYGQSWRKHGEVLSIFANISRKWDRLDTMRHSGVTGTADESLIDTWGDLAVYCLKYAGFLGEVYQRDELPQTFEQALMRVGDYQSPLTWAVLDQLYNALEYILTSPKAYDYDRMKYDCAMTIAQTCIRYIEQSANDSLASIVQKWLQDIEAL